ncbi:MAG: type II secretion system GspH family protein [Scytolyngbya sp. HA4215-MV1]|nr:type II secretion system GspH family protein [Scytolyngbya sp. HA4215-MV1]
MQKRDRNQNLQPQKLSVAGFTLIEQLIIMLILASLSAIAAPGWITFLKIRQLNTAQERTIQVMRKAQSTAIRQKVDWQASFQQVNDEIRWAVHPVTTNPANAVWQTLTPQVMIDPASTLSLTNNIWQVRFTHRGHVSGRLGKLTFFATNQKAKRCVVVSTLLGSIRKGQETVTNGTVTCN